MKTKWEKHYTFALDNLDIEAAYGVNSEDVWKRVFKMAAAIALQEGLEFEDDAFRQTWTDEPSVLIYSTNGEIQEKTKYDNTFGFLFDWYFQTFNELPIGYAFSADDGLDFGI